MLFPLLFNYNSQKREGIISYNRMAPATADSSENRAEEYLNPKAASKARNVNIKLL